MSDEPVPSFPFGPGGFDLTQMLAFLQSSGPLHGDLARQVARMLATGGTPEPDVDPTLRESLLTLVRAAQLHVSDATGLEGAQSAPVEVVGRGAFAERCLEGLEPVLLTLAGRLQMSDADEGPEEPDEPGSPADLFASLLPMLTPMLLGLQAGTMAGNVAQHMLGTYDFPLPLAGTPRIVINAPNVTTFREEWSLPADDFHFVLALHESVHAAVRSVPWVREKLVSLSRDFVDGYRVDQRSVEEHLGHLDLADPSSFQGVLDDPEALLGAIRTPEQERALVALRTFTAVLAGYADHVVSRIGTGLIPAAGQVQEATRRHRVVLGDAERFIERLLGMELTREDYDRGRAFCDGVVERAGADGLQPLWQSSEMSPTPNELAAPGLWLARIELDR